ncbi:hypothetical protein ASG56_10215 [Rhodococcus sp. Leaf7]|nr:hypothetical protein ASG56_10215 [Rhodococcus sp. Leaf7]KQU40012.1 hypothetical protein ASG64_10210 [Rhodococcus sp. Leaf247]
MDATMSAGDIRGVLGLHTRWARVIVTLYVGVLVLVTVQTSRGASSWWPLAAGTIVLALATIGLISFAGDPLPRLPTVLVAAAGPLASACHLVAFPAPFLTPLQAWTHGAGATLFCFLCVRGRPGAAWAGFVGTAATYGFWGFSTDQGFVAGAIYVFPDAGVLLMSTFLSLTLRPNSNSILVLRESAQRRAAAVTASQAAMDERDTRLRHLDRLARPLLERIAHGPELTDAERKSCELLEAHLRDRLRAPALSDPRIDDAARVARSRGVEVMLIDDHGMDDTADTAQQWVRDSVVDTLRRAEVGDVRVRIHPRGRNVMASIFVDDQNGPRRTDFDISGRRTGD